MLEKDIVDRATELLNIVEKVAAVAPQFANLSSEAMAELKQINDAIQAAKVPPAPAPAAPFSDNPQPSTPVPNGIIPRRLESTPSPTFDDDADQGDLNV